MESWIEQLLPIIIEYKDGNDAEPLDGDEVDNLCHIIKTKINLYEGNITEIEAEEHEQERQRRRMNNEDKR